MDHTPIISSTLEHDNLSEQGIDRSLRPVSLGEFTGQPKLKQQFEIFIQAARQRRDALDHVLLFGPPGLGKTTLATSGPVIEKAGDLAAMLTNLEENDVLFIDEIHRLSPAIEEILYPAMEDYRLDIVIGEGPAARSIQLSLPPFTLIGATTRAGLLTSPLRDRFGIVHRLEFYSIEDLATIVGRSAAILDVQTESAGIREVAKRSRGTPRIANRLLRRVRDYSEVKGDGVISGTLANAALEMLEVDETGMDVLDRNLLSALITKFDGGPVGVDSLAAAVSEERGTIEDVIEPYLIQQGYIMRTPRGRVATRLAWQHLGLTMPDQGQSAQASMFTPTDASD